VDATVRQVEEALHVPPLPGPGDEPGPLAPPGGEQAGVGREPVRQQSGDGPGRPLPAAVGLGADELGVVLRGAGTSGTSTSAGNAASGAATQKTVAAVKAGEALNLTEDMFGSKTRVTITLTNVRYGVKPSNQFEKAQNGQFIVADVAVVVNEGKFSISRRAPSSSSPPTATLSTRRT
jgi:hypothetical protein